MMIRPVSLAGIHDPGLPVPRLTDALQPGDHLMSAWPPGETPAESASQCDSAAGLPVPAVEPGTSRLTLARDRASSAGRTRWPQNTISQIPPNTATAPIRSVGRELSSELLTWSFSGAPLRNRTVDLLLAMQADTVWQHRVRSRYYKSEG